MIENVIQIKFGIKINVGASVKNIIYIKKIIFGILLHVVAKMINISREEKDAEEKETIPINFNLKKATCKTRNIYILLAFLLITTALLIAVSIYCYLIKYRVKKHFLPFHVINDKLINVL